MELLWRMKSDTLSSDMSAFKAANPGAVLEDFLRWHSPKDVSVRLLSQVLVCDSFLFERPPRTPCI